MAVDAPSAVIADIQQENGSPPPSPVESSQKLRDRSNFQKGATTGAEIDKQTGKETGTVQERKVALTKETEQKYENYLSTYIANLNHLRNEPHPTATGKTMLDAVLENADHKYDRELWERLAVKEAYQGKLIGINKEETDQRIREFLEKDEGVIIATLLIQDQNFLKLAALGYVASTVPEGQREAVFGKMTFRLNGKENFLSRFWQRTTSNRRTAERIDFSRSADALEMVQNNQAEKAYIRAVSGIDVDVLQRVPGTNKIEFVSPNQINSIMGTSPDRIQEEVLQGWNLIQGFYKDVGIPLERTDFSPLQAIYDRNFLGFFEQPNAPFAKEVQEAYARLLIPNPTPTDTEKMQLYIQANREVMLNRIKGVIVSELAVKEKGQKERRLESVRQKISDRESGAEKTRRTEKAAARKAELETKQTEAKEKQKGSFTFIDEKRDTIKSLEKRFYEELAPARTRGLSFLADVDAELDLVKKALNGDPAANTTSLQSQIADKKEERSNEISVRLGKLLIDRNIVDPGKGAKQYFIDNYNVAKSQALSEATEIANARFNDTIAELQTRKAEYEQKIKDLTALRGQYQDAGRDVVQKEQDFVKDSTKDLVITKKAYDEFVGAAGATITPADLENLTIDQLIQPAITAPYNKLNATPEEQAELRQLLLLAKTEHRAMQIERYDKSDPAQVSAYEAVVNIPNATISPDNLLIMSDDQLMSMLLDAQGPYHLNPANAADNMAVLKNAQAEARKKLIIRHRVGLEEQIKDYDEQIKVQQEIIDRAGNIDSELERLKTTKDVFDRQATILENVDDIVENITRFTDNTVPTVADSTYSKVERDLGSRKGYYEIADLLFDYRQNPEIADRNDYFRRIQVVLPPPKLAEIMNESFGFALGAGFSIDDVLARFRTDVTSGSISRWDIALALEAVIDRIGDETLASLP